MAKSLFASGKYTCVLCKGNKVIASVARGVAPLMDMVEEETNVNGFSAADKIVGKAAAFLYVLLGVSEVYATVMSEDAVAVLEKNGVKAYFDTKVKSIINRAGTGICPMEEAVKNITEPEDAPAAIEAKQKLLANKATAN